MNGLLLMSSYSTYYNNDKYIPILLFYYQLLLDYLKLKIKYKA